MANDATSSLSGTSKTAVAPGAGAPEVTRVPAVRETRAGTVITAEIPAVPAGPSYGVLLPDGSVWYPGSRKRLPAPLLLRVMVWIIAFAVLLAAAGVFVIRYHPTWVRSFRHVVSTQSTSASTKGGTGGTQPPSHPAAASKVTKVVPPPAGTPAGTTVYSVALGSYTVQATATQRAYVSGTFIANGQTVNFEQATIGPGEPAVTELFNVTGGQSLKLQVAHVGVTLSVYYGFDKVASVSPPASVSDFLLFIPATTSGH